MAERERKGKRKSVQKGLLEGSQGKMRTRQCRVAFQRVTKATRKEGRERQRVALRRRGTKSWTGEITGLIIDKRNRRGTVGKVRSQYGEILFWSYRRIELLGKKRRERRKL